jgi:hypothetical protein
MNKLDYLAQKEEELLKMNQRLDLKKDDLLKDAFADSLDSNPFKEEGMFRASTNSKDGARQIDMPQSSASRRRLEEDHFDPNPMGGAEDSSQMQQERLKE